jgi:hypothetical protein
MKTTLLAIATGLAFLAVQANAGGPVIVEDTTETVAPDRDNGWVVPVVIGLLIIGAIASGGGDGVSVDVPDDKPQPCAKRGDGC